MIIKLHVFVLFIWLFPELSGADDFRSTIDSLADYSTEISREIDADNISIPIENGEVFLERGKLYLTGYFHDLPTALFFMGSGQFNFSTENPIERDQIRRFYQTDSVSVKFDQLYIVFPGGSELSFRFENMGLEKEPPYQVRTMLKGMRKVPDKKFKFNLPLNIYKATIENRQDFLWINALKKRYYHTVYFFDPYAEEEIALYKYTSNFKTPQIVSSFSSQETADNNNQINLFQYDMDLDISTTGKSSIVCRMLIEVLFDSTKIIEFGFPAKYSVDSVLGNIVDSTSFIKKKNRPGLAVELDQFYNRRDTVELDVYYRTNLFRHYLRYGAVQDHLTHWYPYNGYRQLSEYRLRYTIVDGYDFISVGKKRSDSIVEDKRVIEYIAEYPTPYISFNYGVFDSVVVDTADVPINIRFLKSDSPTAILGNPHIKKLTEDITASFKFYEKSFAPYPFDRLDVTPMAVGFGQGSPGVVHLSLATFKRSIEGFDDRFRAHEVAHQWWGQLINPKSYHDVWLSEGFAEYSAGLYILKVKEDKNLFREVLEIWSDNVTKGSKNRDEKSIGYKAGPIILGHRLNSELSPGDFIVLNYYKAACLLHMLRFELIQKYGGDNEFFEMLAAYAKKYSGKLVSSKDFIEEVRPYLSELTDQFFAQWLYDWHVPKIKKKSNRNKDGSADIELNVTEVGEKFLTPYPVRFIFEDKSVLDKVYKIRPGLNRFEFEGKETLKIKKILYDPGFDILEQ